MIQRVGYGHFQASLTPEDEAALAWLQSQDGIDASSFVLADEPDLTAFDIVWLHLDRAGWETPPDRLDALASYVKQGGRLLLTNFAAFLPHALGIEDHPPEARPCEIQDHGFGRGYGFQSLRGHPLFEAFHGGLYLWYADTDHTAWRVGYFDDAWPAQGRVLGIEKSYITLHQDHKLIIEHEVGAGRVLSAGAFIHFEPLNHLAQHTRHFIRHAFQYLARPESPEKATYWARNDVIPRAVPIPPSLPLPEIQDDWNSIEPSDLSLTRDEATDTFFDVAGRRCLMMGREHGGLDEIWVHPLRLLRDLEIGLLIDGAVRWLHACPAHVEIRPEAVRRTYRLPTGTLTETLMSALDRPGGLIRLQAHDTGPLRLLLRFRVDLRLMWPYREHTLGALHYGYDTGLHALHVHDRSGEVYALIGTDALPDAYLGGVFSQIDYVDGQLRGTPTDENQVYQAFVFTLDDTARYLAFAGSNQGRSEVEETYRTLHSDPTAIYNEAAQHYRHLLSTKTMVTSPDGVFNEGYRWALVGADRFRATTPGLGTGLLAGYATSDRGWDGGHRISGRPGYAWYFGRDAAWAGLALCAYGDVETIRHQLDLFDAFQDVSGKVFHELTTSGAVHYDAADATPLYVILAAHYVRASGDLDTLRHLWPSLLHAMAFCYATDTDGDGLIENTNVGHAWIEGGPLFGAHTTLYLAGLWAQALADAAYLADLLDQREWADRFEHDARFVLRTLHRYFWHAESGFFYHSLRPDDTFLAEPTVLPAVLMCFGLLDPARVETMLDAFASDAFSTDWGVRLTSNQSSRFDPESYHGGTIWPLFTGWTALAEYTYGRSEHAFDHVRSNLLLYRHHSLGVAAEVLHGTRFEPMRVCPHQCWSETGTLHPILAGLVGFHPDAPRHSLRLEPRPPRAWDTFRVENLWVGSSRLNIEMKRDTQRVVYRLSLTEGPAVEVDFAPEIDPGCRISQVFLNEIPRIHRQRGPLGLLEHPLNFRLDGAVEVELRFEH